MKNDNKNKLNSNCNWY